MEAAEITLAIITLLSLLSTWYFFWRQNRRMQTQMQAQMYADLIDKDRELAKYFIEHPDIAKIIYGQGNVLYGNDDSDARAIWSTILAADWYENLFIQHYFKAIASELMPHWRSDIANGWVQSAAYRSDHWNKLKGLYWREFVEACEGKTITAAKGKHQ